MKDDGIPDLFIEKLLLDELPPRMKERLLQDPAVQRRLEELKAENRSILETYPPEAMAEAIRGRSRRSRQAESGVETSAGPAGSVKDRAWAPPRFGRPGAPLRRLRRPGAPLRLLIPAAGFALLVLAGGLLLITRGPAFFAPQDQASEIRLKGGKAHLTVYMQTDSGPQVLQEGDRVSPGTTLQVGYVAGANKYGAIISIDGRGTVTLHFPVSPITGSELEGEGEVLLPFAYTLDDAPQFERFFFIVSEKSFSVGAVLEAAEHLAEEPENAKSQNLRLPVGLEQSSILLLK